MLTKMVVRKVKQVTVEKSYLQVAKMHVTKLHVFYEGVTRPIELLLFSDEQITIGEVQGETQSAPATKGRSGRGGKELIEAH